MGKNFLGHLPKFRTNFRGGKENPEKLNLAEQIFAVLAFFSQFVRTFK